MKYITWVNDKGVFYTASSFGRCIRSLVASRLGYDQAPPPQRLQKIFTAGHAAEDACVKALTERGWIISGQQDDVSLPIQTRFGTIYVVGHMDGIYDATNAIDPPEALTGIAEIKSQGKASWDTYETSGATGPLWDTYAWQASIYMHARQQPLTWIRFQRDDSTEENPIFATHTLIEPPYSLSDIKARIEEIEQHVEDGFLPDCDPFPTYGCPFYYLHDDDQDEKEAPREIKGLEALVRKYDRYRADEATLKEARDKIAKEITALLAEHSATKAVEGRASVVMIERKTKSLSKIALKAAGIDLSPYQTEKVSRYPQVTYEQE